jgi:NADH-quinone oxidoreductase subunit C
MSIKIPAALEPVEAVKGKVDGALLHVKTFAGETTLVIAGERVADVLKYLKGGPGLAYNFLSDITAVDYYPADYGDEYDGDETDFRPERFGVSWHLYSMLYNRRIRVKAFAMEEEPILPTSTTLWANADWLEREIMDMMGVQFEGHPDPRRLLMPDDWHGHPHRRDYPLGYETPMFSFNVEEIAKSKPFAKE